MALKITRKSDAITIETLVSCIYGPPGVGKTTLAFSAKNPLLLDFDSGAYRAPNRGDIVQVASWTDIADMDENDLGDYDTLIVDTAGRLLDRLAQDIIKRNPKNSRGAGALSLQGFGVLKTDFYNWLNMVRGYGLDIVLVAHSDEQHKGDDLIERLDMQGSSKNEVYKSADLMGRIGIRNNKRVLLFDPTDSAFGKNPAGMDALEIPRIPEDDHQFLGNVIESVKNKLNEMTEEQKVKQEKLDAWRESLEGMSTADELDNAVIEANKLDDSIKNNVKRIINAVANSKGFTYDKEQGKFAAKEKKEEA